MTMWGLLQTADNGWIKTHTRNFAISQNV